MRKILKENMKDLKAKKWIIHYKSSAKKNNMNKAKPEAFITRDSNPRSHKNFQNLPRSINSLGRQTKRKPRIVSSIFQAVIFINPKPANKT
jgi:hypothetical protein